MLWRSCIPLELNEKNLHSVQRGMLKVFACACNDATMYP